MDPSAVGDALDVVRQHDPIIWSICVILLACIFWLIKDRREMQERFDKELAVERAESQAARTITERWSDLALEAALRKRREP